MFDGVSLCLIVAPFLIRITKIAKIRPRKKCAKDLITLPPACAFFTSECAKIAAQHILTKIFVAHTLRIYGKMRIENITFFNIFFATLTSSYYHNYTNHLFCAIIFYEFLWLLGGHNILIAICAHASASASAWW